MRNSQIREKIIVRAWKDPQFKNLLLKNPRAAFKEMGVEISENIQVNVIEESASSYTFVIPASPANVSKLSEKELAAIVGAGSCQNKHVTV